MKRLLMFFLAILFTSQAFSQINRYSGKPIPANVGSDFVPMDYGAISNAIQRRQAEYDNNLKRIDANIDWIYELKEKTNDPAFIKILDSQYKTLRSFDGKDLSRMDSQIRDVELKIKEAIYNYNEKIKKQGRENRNVEKDETYLKSTNQDYERIVIEESTKIKDKASVLGDVLRVVLAGETIYITGCNDNFWEVYYNDMIGYVMKDVYFKTTSKLDRFQNKQIKVNLTRGNNKKTNISSTSQNAEQYNTKAYDAYKNEDYDSALKYITRAIETDPNDVYAYNFRGVLYSNSQDYKKAIVDFTKSLQLQPEQEEIYYQRGRSNYSLKRDIEALNDFTKAIGINSNYVNSYFMRGVLYLYGLKNYENAILDFTKVLQMAPEQEGSYYYRGFAFFYANKKIDAIKDFTKTINCDPNNLDAYFYRGYIKTDLGDRKGAISDYDKIISNKDKVKSDRLATVYNNKAYCLVFYKKYKEALSLVNMALEITNNIDFIWDTRGEIHYKLGKYNKCISDMDMTIKLNKEAENAFYYRGLANIKLGNKEEGYKDLSKAGELGKVEAFEILSNSSND